jgi:hypothetical protein
MINQHFRKLLAILVSITPLTTLALEKPGNGQEPWTPHAQQEEQIAGGLIEELTQVAGDADADDTDTREHKEWKTKFKGVLSELKKDQGTVVHGDPLERNNI